MKHTVEVTQSALTQMLLNGFEAFVIKHSNNKRSGIEFHASIYGDIEVNDKEDKCRSIIQFISADTSAKMGSGSGLAKRKLMLTDFQSGLLDIHITLLFQTLPEGM